MSGAGCDVASLPATRVQFGLGAVLQRSNAPRGRIRGRERGRSALPGAGYGVGAHAGRER
jgi:hypothetical protein